MKRRHSLAILSAIALIIATGCVTWDNDFSPLRIIKEELGICNKSISDYNKRIRKDPKDYGAYMCRGRAYLGEGHFDEAISDFTKATEIFPESDIAYYNRGNAYGEKGLYDMSISDYTKAIEINPKRAGPYFMRGQTYYEKKGLCGMAISDYTKAIELYQKDSRLYNNLAWVLATCPDSTYRNGNEALKLAKKAVEMESAAITLDTLAAAYAEVGNFEDAIKTQEQAIYHLKEKGEEEELAELEERLDSYKAKKPWRE